MIEIIISSIPVFIGAGSAFLLNYLHEQGKIKEKEIIKSREFLSRLYTITNASYNYYLKHSINKQLEGKSFEEIWKSLPPYTARLVPNKTPLKASEVSFCAKSEEHKDFLSNAFMYELDVERINTMIEKQSELVLEIEKEIQNYIVEQEIDETVSVLDLDYKEVLGYRKAKSYEMLCKDILGIMPSIYLEGMELQKQHREIMKELYPNEEIREFVFEIPGYKEREKIEKERKEKIKKFHNKIIEQIKE